MKFLQPVARLLADVSNLRCAHNRSNISSTKTKMLCLANFEEKAKQNLDKEAWDYYSSGADLQQSLRDNVEAFSRYIVTIAGLHK